VRIAAGEHKVSGGGDNAGIGFFVVTVADIIRGEWWRWFAWRAARPTP
jgi:hypothetical protein